MATTLQLALWNANGLHRHEEELKTFLSLRNIDNMLISETRSQSNLCNRKTNWDYFHHLITTNLNLHVPLKTEAHIEERLSILLT
jgi:hypothetical protein